MTTSNMAYAGGHRHYKWMQMALCAGMKDASKNNQHDPDPSFDCLSIPDKWKSDMLNEWRKGYATVREKIQ